MTIVDDKGFVKCHECGHWRRRNSYSINELDRMRPVCSYCRKKTPDPVESFHVKQLRMNTELTIGDIEQLLMYGGLPENERNTLYLAMKDLTDQLLYPKPKLKQYAYTITMKEGILSISDIKYK